MIFLMFSVPFQQKNTQEVYCSQTECMHPLLKGLGKNKTLKRLGLAWNGIKSDNFASYLQDALEDNDKLEELNLESNL